MVIFYQQKALSSEGPTIHKLGDVRPGYTGASPLDYPLDCQGNVASKLHSGVAT